MTYDFSGYATKNNVRCSDGRTIMPNAFEDCDGAIVPLVWQHVHDSTDNILGHAELENRPDGVYAYCYLNSTPAGENARELVRHGDINALSIYANRLQQRGQDVIHGVIREVSLVLAGANPGATIDNLAFAHSDGSTTISEDEACICFVDEDQHLEHADESDLGDNPTIGEVLDTMTDLQKQAVYALVGSLEEEREKKPEEASEKEEKAEKEEEGKLEHADEAEKDEKPQLSAEEIETILKDLDVEQMKVVEDILDAVQKGEQAPESTASVFETFTDKQKEAVYALAGALLPDASSEDVKHSDGEEEPVEEVEEENELHHADETIGDVLDTLDDAQKKAVEQILKAVAEGSEEVSKETADVFETLSEKQKEAVYALVGLGLDEEESDEEDSKDEVKHSDQEGETMKFNIFDAETDETTVLSHDDMKAIFDDAPRYGTLKESVLQHGITDIEVLFPEAQAVNAQPYQLARRMEWVSVVLNGVRKSPFARIKSTAANLTEESARAKGYVKGRKKIEEQISALRRVTTPQTVYKLQKLDRDDVIDITDFDVVAFMKLEMRQMLDEEIARAILVGDGRAASDPEKIFEDHIRSVWKDDEMYTIHQVIATANATNYTAIIDDIVRSRKNYKGSGNPVMFIGPDMLTEMRLLKDNDNKFRYESDSKLAEAMRVSSIHEVELFDDLTRTVDGKDRKLVAIILNLADYTVGANKGGEVSLFDDFDLDFNKMEYLIEARMSGALTMPKSAIAIEIQTTTTSTPEPVYEKVASPVVADIADYYEQDEYGRYVKTVDVAIKAGKDYYELAE